MKTYRQIRIEMDAVDLQPMTEAMVKPAPRVIALQIFQLMRTAISQARGANNGRDRLLALSELLIQHGAIQYLVLGEVLKDKQVRSLGKMMGNL